MRPFLWLILIFDFVGLRAQQQPWLSSHAMVELSDIYVTTQNSKSNLSDEESAYLSAYAQFLSFIKDEQKDHINLFEEERSNLEGLSKSNNQQSDLMLINIQVQQGLLRLMNDDRLEGVYSIYKSYNAFESLDSSRYNALEYKKLNALFLIFADQVESGNSFVSWLFGIDGDEDLGFRQLKAYLQEVKPFEGLYVEGLVLFAYCKLKFSELNDLEFKWLLAEAANIKAPLLTFVVLQNGIKLHYPKDELLSIMNMDDQIWLNFPLLNYLKGRILLNVLNSDGEQALKLFLTQYQGYCYKTDAQLRLARFKHIQGLNHQRDSLLTLIEEASVLPTSIDRQAGNEYVFLKDRPLALSKARFLFDGGQYKKARMALDDAILENCPAFYRVEWWYRLGRIEHKLLNTSAALQAYNQVIQLSDEDKRYYGPYAALFSARLVLNNKVKANYYLEKARELNTGEYKRDITLEIEALSESLK